mmetsp:Transcript_12190/g.50460  ORF Transcript_12190/g.50460 Transcript_12190/m.50460 type:complete len:117 (-) Transcript_12190:854-1204(-)
MTQTLLEVAVQSRKQIGNGGRASYHKRPSSSGPIFRPLPGRKQIYKGWFPDPLKRSHMFSLSNVLLKKSAVEVISNCVINKTPLDFLATPGLISEDDILIPSSLHPELWRGALRFG